MTSSPPPCIFDHPPAKREGVGIAQIAPFNPAAFETAVTDLLRACGVAPDSVHTGKTAKRVRELWEKRLLGGYSIDPAEALGEGFDDDREDMVVVRGIAIHGVCPHHLVPFRGIAHVAYIPGGRLHGFGRIARMVDAIGHRFTYQEWMTRDVAEALITHGKARGAACVIEAEQLCLLLGEDRRGDERVYTQAFAGLLQDDAAKRAEFLQAITRKGP
jgi:GTP cyclohydrolase I